MNIINMTALFRVFVKLKMLQVSDDTKYSTLSDEVQVWISVCSKVQMI